METLKVGISRDIHGLQLGDDPYHHDTDKRSIIYNWCIDVQGKMSAHLLIYKYGH